ncbi:S8 family peptidase [Clostridium sp.]|uniref:S8 family peptidase n=1 Tax=Clostridium sp. TaxID=1506 RepID=UPI002624FC58|nr:S8 family peptidase [Clostridium sp.]
MNRIDDINKNIFNNNSYFHYIVEYTGNPKKEITKYPDFRLTIINSRYAILSLPMAVSYYYPNLSFETIIYIQPYDVYSLQDISPLEASQANFLQLDLPLNLKGNGVLIAVIDTGIDYLSEEFMDSDGNTRIDYIWDQSSETIINQNSILQCPFGAIYTSEDIQKAINLSKKGGDPYSIVPVKDTIGHGTKMSCLIGGSGKNPEYRGVVPNCRFMVVKLAEEKKLFDLYKVPYTPVFNASMIFTALEFVYIYVLNFFIPVVIYLPLGTTLGSHDGNNTLDKYIDNICFTSGIAIVTGTGNEKGNGLHASGTLTQEDPIQSIDIDVSPEQKNLFVDIWVILPDIYSIDIISPSGENTGIINYVINNFSFYTFTFEETEVSIFYSVPEQSSGMERIRLQFINLQPGIWKIRIIGNLVVSGIFNAYLPQLGLTVGGTQFSPSDPYNTITNPGNSRFIITAAAYNQNNNNITSFSGMSSNASALFSRYLETIDVAAGGVNAITIAPNNERAIVSGTSVSAAIVAGACAMLFEWGIIEGNDPNMFSQTIKTYLSRGVTERPGDIYPNPQWGYGILSIFNIFRNIT